MDFFAEYVSNDEYRLIATILLLSIGTLIYLVFKWFQIILFLNKHREYWTMSKIEHVGIGLVFVMRSASFHYWTLYHPTMRGLKFLSVDYATHLHSDIIGERLVATFAFSVVLNLLLAYHIRIKNGDEK